MRRLFAGSSRFAPVAVIQAAVIQAAVILVVTSLIAQPALAAQRCAAPGEQAMFELAALKSELLVLAIACKRSDSYNAFVQRYRPALLDLDKNLNAHFKRVHGGRWQKAADDFTTEMVNVRSTMAARIGGDHCPRNAVLFSEVMALAGPPDLPAYAAGKDLLADSATTCAASHAPAARPVAARAATARPSAARPAASPAVTRASTPAARSAPAR